MPEAPSTEALTLRPVHWLLLLLCTAALYYPAIQFDYLNYDDHLYLLEDPAIRSLGLANLKTILFEPYFAAWYPLTRLSHAIEYAVFGGNPAGAHLVNILSSVVMPLHKVDFYDEREVKGQMTKGV